ncbi:DNA primase catalytic subunit PriS [Candidatus Micrarchaeota archaeon]|nr:DNA primase catalytic subunit PriS [Candidatus Micrarchaeota archaeon]
MTEPLMEAAPHDSKGRQLVRSLFRSYYGRSQSFPSELVRREFGFGFTKKIDFRHKAFLSQREFAEYVQLEVPLFMSYSAALYEKPAATPMNKKGFLGADLVFDLDTSYEKEKHGHNPILCPYCLERVKQDCIALVERFLVQDFGFSEKELFVNYSGSKGYHIHVNSEAVRQLSAEGRKQLLSYITATDLDLGRILRKEFFAKSKDSFVLRGPSARARGWAKKLFDAAYAFVDKADLPHFKAEGISVQRANKIMENKAFVLERMTEGNWDSLRGMEPVWQKLLRKAVAFHSLEVDKAVTFDLARLIRLENSLHGDTGFIAKKVSLKDLPDFVPQRDALAFSPNESHWIKSKVTGTLEIAEQKFELKEGKITELPENAVVFLLCKQKAELK